MESRGAKGGQSAGTCLAVRGQRCGIRAGTVCSAERHGEGGTWPKTVSNLPELYVAVDVEADGPIPGPYSMISLGMAVAGRPDLTFYTELRPISDDFVPQALAVSGLDRDRLLREAPPAEDAMRGRRLGQRPAAHRPPGVPRRASGLGRHVRA